MDGYGEFTWLDGRRYLGHYSNDLKHGVGTYQWKAPNGELKVYCGFWKEGK